MHFSSVLYVVALHSEYTRSFTVANLCQGCMLLVPLITAEAFDAVIRYLQSDTGMTKEGEEQVCVCVLVCVCVCVCVCVLCVCAREDRQLVN